MRGNRRRSSLAGRLPILVAAAGLLAGCVQTAPRSPAADLRAPDRLRVRVEGRVISVPVEDYVAATVLSEVTPLGESPDVAERIFEVQAIVARTYALANVGRHQAEGFDVCDETHCQLYQPDRLRTSRFATAARDATARTAGLVVEYGSRLAETVFHADCGGHLADAHDVWGGPAVPYLRTGTDEVPGVPHRQWTLNVDRQALLAALKRDDRTSVGSRLSSVDVITRDSGGRALEVRLEGETRRSVRAEVFRSVLNRSVSGAGLQSTSFTVSATSSGYLFEGQGFGHGVGLCQAGAAGRARRGDDLERILGAYYPGTRLVRLESAQMSPEFLLPGRVRPATIP